MTGHSETMYIGRRIRFAKSDHCYSFVWVVHGARIVGSALPNIEKLPEEGEEAGACAEAVVRIAGEVAAEHFFFVEEAEDNQWNDEEEARERPPGAQRRSREE